MYDIPPKISRQPFSSRKFRIYTFPFIFAFLPGLPYNPVHLQILFVVFKKRLAFTEIQEKKDRFFK